MDDHDEQLSEEDLAAARELTRRGVQGTVPALVGFTGLAAGAAGAVVAAVLDAPGVLVTALACALIGALLGTPLVMLIAVVAKRRGIQMGIEKIVWERALERDSRRREFERQLGRALEMADDELSAFDVVSRAMRSIAPETPTELLLADNSHAHLERVVTVAPEGEDAPGCPVGSPDRCVAARRAQTQVFTDSEDLDACPMLRDRAIGRCSAVCVPVSIMGRTVGVVHAVGAPGQTFSDDAVQELQTLATHSGNRIGMLRVMAETQLQASTDGLTGLVNRRSLENAMRRLRTEGRTFSFVMADLDHFKNLNDAHGHEAGDRALRIFSEAIRNAMRADDIACRYGGEEFALVLPGTDQHDALEVIERVRNELIAATARGDAPAFTASFGVAHSSDADDLEDLVHRADRAMFTAKQAGRDRICLDGHNDAVAPLTALA